MSQQQIESVAERLPTTFAHEENCSALELFQVVCVLNGPFAAVLVLLSLAIRPLALVTVQDSREGFPSWVREWGGAERLLCVVEIGKSFHVPLKIVTRQGDYNSVDALS